MAEPIEFELRATGADETRAALDSVSGGFESMGSQWSQLSIGLNQAVELFGRITGAVTDAARMLSEFAGEAETLAGLANNLGTSIEEAARRTGGMVTNLELMQAATSLSARGLNLTERELANLAVAAERMKDQGLDVTMESLGEAVHRGGPRMRMLGIEATTTEGALRELEDRFGDVEEGADSALGAVGRFETALSNVRSEMTLSIGQSEALKRSIDDLIHVFDSDLDGSGLMRDLKTNVPVAISALIDQFRHLTQGTLFYVRMDYIAALREFSQVGIGGFMRDVETRATQQLEGELATATAGANRAGADARRRALQIEAASFDVFGPAPGSGGAARRGGRGGGGGRGDRRDRGAEFDAEQGFESEVMGSELAPHRQATAMAEVSQDALDKMAEGLDEAEDGAKDLEAAMKDVAEANREAGIEMQALGEFMGEVSGQMAEAFTALAEGEAFSVGEMLKSLGKQQVASGIAKIFEGTGMLITLNPGGAAMVATGAAQLAFGMGLGAAGSAGGSPGGASGGASARPERDTGGSGGGSRDGGNVIINYHTPVPQEQVGRMQDTAKRAAERRWGTRATA